MSNLCVFGLQWGDEGKGKVVDMLAAEFDVVARYQGGSNAGHTVFIGAEKFVLHLVPTGILRKGKDCVIGNGVVLDLQLAMEEIKDLRARGVEVGANLRISDRAHLVMPYHKSLDGLDGTRLRGPLIGTTQRGIGPCYEDKMARIGFRVAELYHPAQFEERLRQVVGAKNRLLARVYGRPPVNWRKVYDESLIAAEELRPFVCDTAAFLRDAIRAGRRILCEGAQGVLLDVDFGTYPFVTSSNAGVGGALSGLGLAPKDITRVMGVMKAYVTRIGEGPFPTEADERTSARLRRKGEEYGATTGRPRRCGWFDAVAVRHTCRLNGTDSIALTKLDVLTGEKELRVCVGYRLNGRVCDALPADIGSLRECKPVYQRLPGWRDRLDGVQRFEDLPDAVQAYVAALERMVEVPIDAISLGPEREQVIFRPGWDAGW